MLNSATVVPAMITTVQGTKQAGDALLMVVRWSLMLRSFLIRQIGLYSTPALGKKGLWDTQAQICG